MSKIEFLNRLGVLLQDIPDDEKTEALRYYEDYFADAEDQDEDELVEKLGTPESIAKQIKLDLYNKASKEGGVYTESGYTNTYYEEEKNSPEVVGTKQTYHQSYGPNNAGGYNQNAYNQNANNGQPYGSQYNNAPRTKNNNIALIVLLVITSPIWAGAGFGIIAGIGGTLIGITFGTIGSAIGLGIGGVACIGFGIWQLFVSPMAGLFLLGTGCILIALALLCLILFLLIITRLIPWIVQVISRVFNQIFHKGGR